MLSKLMKPSLMKKALAGNHLRQTAVRTMSMGRTSGMLANLQKPNEVTIDSPKDMPSLINCAQGER